MAYHCLLPYLTFFLSKHVPLQLGNSICTLVSLGHREKYAGSLKVNVLDVYLGQHGKRNHTKISLRVRV